MDTTREPRLGRLDLVGLRCPLPVLKSRRALAALAPGDRLEVLTSDPLASIDLPHMCSEEGHLLVSMDGEGDRGRFVIERGPDRSAQENPEKPEI
jgi:tRNA 2-thiouridine synthesizing protein A